MAPMTGLWAYNRWPSGEPYGEWAPASRGLSRWDRLDFHVDLGCGKLKKGRIGVDRYAAPGVNVVANLDGPLTYAVPRAPGEDAYLSREASGLPFPDDSIHSMVSHHALEHIGDGFLALMDECYRVLRPGAIFRIIVPLFPSWSAVSDPDHRRYFMADAEGHSTFDAFCGTPGDAPSNCWLASFSVPYTSARFEKVDQDMTPPVPPHQQWTAHDARELRVALRVVK